MKNSNFYIQNLFFFYKKITYSTEKLLENIKFLQVVFFIQSTWFYRIFC